MSKNLDKIHIRDLLLRCIIGVYDWEREKKQDVIINITLKMLVFLTISMKQLIIKRLSKKF